MRIVRMLGGEQVTVEDAPVPECPDGHALVRIRASALCGSELHGYRSDAPQSSNAGHEAMGEVVEVRGVQGVRVGDRVGVHAVWGCGACAQCAQGRYTWCRSFRVPAGYHAEYVCAPAHVLLPLPDDMPDGVGVLLSGDGLGVPFHAQKRLRTKPGDVVCVIGVGPVGLGNVLMQSHAGADVVAIDRNAYRLKLASQLGASHTIDAGIVDPLAGVADLTGGRPPSACIECVGRPETLRLALSLVGHGGTVMAIGEQGAVPVSISEDLIRRDIALTGSWFFHFGEFDEMVEAWRSGLRVAELITHSFSIEEAGEAFREFAAGRTAKALLRP